MKIKYVYLLYADNVHTNIPMSKKISKSDTEKGNLCITRLC